MRDKRLYRYGVGVSIGEIRKMNLSKVELFRKNGKRNKNRW